MERSDRWYRPELLDFMNRHFSMSELREIAFTLGINHEELPHETAGELSRGLIEYFERRNNLGTLLSEIVRRRDDPAIKALLGQVPSAAPRRLIQTILITSMPLAAARREALLAQLEAVLTKELTIPPSEIEILATAPGSLRVLVGLPAAAADQLVAHPPATLGGLPVQSLTPFEALSPAQQAAWRAIALHSSP